MLETISIYLRTTTSSAGLSIGDSLEAGRGHVSEGLALFCENSLDPRNTETLPTSLWKGEGILNTG